jgi:hypothetical protein
MRSPFLSLLRRALPLECLVKRDPRQPLLGRLPRFRLAEGRQMSAGASADRSLISHRFRSFTYSARGKTAHREVAGYFGSKRFVAAATANTSARITSKEVYEPVESKARPNMTGPVAPAAA